MAIESSAKDYKSKVDRVGETQQLRRRVEQLTNLHYLPATLILGLP